MVSKKKRKQSAKRGGDKTTPRTKEGERGVRAGGVFVRRGGESRRRERLVPAHVVTDKNTCFVRNTPPRRDKEIGNIHVGYIGRG